jgi:hypothetical protein
MKGVPMNKKIVKVGLPSVAVLMLFGMFVLALESQVLYRTEAVYRGQNVKVNVQKHRIISFRTDEHFAVGMELFEENGLVKKRTGMAGYRGHPPLFSVSLASSEERTFYRAFFPKG